MQKPILYVNACVRTQSRTDRIARALIKKLGGAAEEVCLKTEGLCPLSEERLAKRTALIEAGRYDDDMFRLSRQFAAAETIVVSAPFWDMSFPALLKLYVENIYVTGIVSEYGADGRPHGLCRAGRLYYVTTAGGSYAPEYGYAYMQRLATEHFGIPETALVKAEMLDVEGFDAEEIVEKTIASLTL